MKYLKKFDTHSDYETFTGSTDFVLPNVSVCVNENGVHYNPYYDPILKFTAEEANCTIQLNRVGTARSPPSIMVYLNHYLLFLEFPRSVVRGEQAPTYARH